MFRSRIPSAKVTEVIELHSVTGDGTEADPVRRVVYYFDLNGNFLAKFDCLRDSIPMLEGFAVNRQPT